MVVRVLHEIENFDDFTETDPGVYRVLSRD